MPRRARCLSKECSMRNANFLREQNAKPIWHPMASPSDMHASPPKIIMKADGVHVIDIDGKRLLDAVGGLWNVNLGYSCGAGQTGDPRPARHPALLFGLSRHLDGSLDRTRLRIDPVLCRRWNCPGILYLRRIRLGRDRAQTGATILESMRPTGSYEIHIVTKRISRHAFRRRIGYGGCELPP